MSHTPDVDTEETADTALGTLLSAVRQLPQAGMFVMVDVTEVAVSGG